MDIHSTVYCVSELLFTRYSSCNPACAVLLSAYLFKHVQVCSPRPRPLVSLQEPQQRPEQLWVPQFPAPPSSCFRTCCHPFPCPCCPPALFLPLPLPLPQPLPLPLLAFSFCALWVPRSEDNPSAPLPPSPLFSPPPVTPSPPSPPFPLCLSSLSCAPSSAPLSPPLCPPPLVCSSAVATPSSSRICSPNNPS